MSDVVKAEIRAVRDLRTAIERYAEQLREAAHTARRETTAAETRAREAVDQCRSALERALREVEQARAALARAPRERRAELQRALAAAEQRAAKARGELDRARQAERMVAGASSDLRKQLHAAGAVVAAQSSAASSVLRELERKLADIVGGRAGSFVRNAVTTIGVAAEIAVTVADFSKIAGNASQGFLPTADRVDSISAMAELQTEQLQQQYQGNEEERLEREYRGEGVAGA